MGSAKFLRKRSEIGEWVDCEQTKSLDLLQLIKQLEKLSLCRR